MTEVIAKGRVPKYVAKCEECQSVFTYNRADTIQSGMCGYGYLNCPVCGAEMSVNYEKYVEDARKEEV